MTPGESDWSDAVTVTVPAPADVTVEPTDVEAERSCFVEYLKTLVVERSAGFTVADREAPVVVTVDAAARVTTGATAVTEKDREVVAGA